MQVGFSTSAVDQLVITLFFCAESFSRGLLLATIALDLVSGEPWSSAGRA